MPIGPERMKLYPGGSIRSPEWLAIRAFIQARAGDRCEGSPAYPDCRARNGEPHPVTGSTVVCTVAHLTHDESCGDPALLRFWCQRCHNTYDAIRRRENARKRLALGDLFEAGGVVLPMRSASRLAGERSALTQRAKALPPRSLSRKAIEARLVRLTADQLRLELGDAP